MRIPNRETALGERLYYVTFTQDGELFEDTFPIWERPARIKQTLHFLEVRNGNGWQVQSVKQKDFTTGRLKEVVYE